MNIPILMIAGGRDINGSYIANTDYAVLEFIRHKKDNLHYKVFPNYVHNYAETKTNADGEQYISVYQSKIVVDDICQWSNTNQLR